MAATALKLGRRQYLLFIAQHQQMVLINLKNYKTFYYKKFNLKKRKKDT